VRRLLKFLHTLGAAGLIGALAALLILMSGPAPTSPATYAASFRAMGDIAQWIFLPSLTLTLIAGLLAIAVNPAFHEAGWAWAKAATGILIFEGGLHVLGSIQDGAKRAAVVFAGQLKAGAATGLANAERNTLWVMLAVTVANVALGIWRPRLPRLPI
jgi:hypothetical protein